MREIDLLREAMNLYGISFDRAGMFIGVPGNTVRRWIRGEFKPNHIYQNAIIVGVKKIEAEYERRLDMEKLPSGGEVSKAWFGNLTGDTIDPADDSEAEAEAAEAKVSKDLAKFFDKIQASATDGERVVLNVAWPGFAEVVKMLRRRGIKFIF